MNKLIALTISSFFITLLSAAFCLLLTASCLAQTTITGTIKDASSSETLIGATVLIKGTTEGAVTNVDGNFSFITNQPLPVTLVATFVGYTNIETTVTSVAAPVIIRLKKNEVLLKNVTVTGSRISEKQKESPLTIEAMDFLAIKETPAVNFYEGLGQLKGVDLTSASIGFKIINTRGFNSSSPVRSLQIIDGVDNASPGLNFSLGNFLGASELDVQKVDLIVGASSAYYGPNAFNGVISMTSRSPFAKPGLEFYIKGGSRSLNEFALRYAEVVRNKKGEDKLGVKINLFRLSVKDWPAENYSATLQSKSSETNPGGYDAVNIYGDEYQNGFDLSQNAKNYPGIGIIARRGYMEKDLVDYNTNNMKLGAAMHYKIKPETEILAATNYGTGTTIYQGDNRYCLKDIKFYQHRLEIKKQDKWFLRGYYTKEDAGKSYDAFFTALLLQRSAKIDGEWYQDYLDYWFTKVQNNLAQLPGFPQPPTPPYTTEEYVAYLDQINPFLAANYPDTLNYFHNLAQEFASGEGNPLNQNQPFFEPGTYEFDTAFAGITSRKTFSQGGSRLFDQSKLYHIHGEYKFTPKWLDITIGGNYRQYLPSSDGTIFSDTSYITRDSVFYESTDSLIRIDTTHHKTKITNSEFGVYAGLEKRFFKNKLKLNFTMRMDKNENFDYLYSPAASIVFSPFKEHVLRVSYSSAIRNPTLTDQYLYYQVGRAILVGNKDGYDGLVTVQSLIDFFDYNKKFDTLSFFNVKPVRPEEVKTIEGGYRTTLFNRLYLDVSAYFSTYKYFIGYKIGADVDTFSYPVIDFLGDTSYIKDLRFNNVLRVATNSEDLVTTNGFSVGLNYYFGKHFAFITNYSYNVLDRLGSDDPLIPAFNTPRHKYNIGVNGRDIKGFGFNINYKWIEGFYYEGSPQFTGAIATYDMVDAQVNYRFLENYLTLKVGCSNLLDNKHYEIYGGPLVGRMFYTSLLFEFPEKR